MISGPGHREGKFGARTIDKSSLPLKKQKITPTNQPAVSGQQYIVALSVFLRGPEIKSKFWNLQLKPP